MVEILVASDDKSFQSTSQQTNLTTMNIFQIIARTIYCKWRPYNLIKPDKTFKTIKNSSNGYFPDTK